MDMRDILVLFDKKKRIDVEYPGVRKQGLPYIIRYLQDPPGMNFILLTYAHACEWQGSRNSWRSRKNVYLVKWLRHGEEE
jgi:hypothetical protein